MDCLEELLYGCLVRCLCNGPEQHGSFDNFVHCSSPIYLLALMARLLARCCYFNLLRAIDRALAALSHTLAAYGSCQFSAIWQAFSPQIVASAPTTSKMLYLSTIASSNSRSCFFIVVVPFDVVGDAHTRTIARAWASVKCNYCWNFL